MGVTAGRIDYRKFDYQLGIGFSRALIAKLAYESGVIGLVKVFEILVYLVVGIWAWMQ